MSASDQPLAAYTDAQVAAALNVSKRTVYRLRKSGALRAVSVGRAVRIPADALARFLERDGGTQAKRKGNDNADQSSELLPQQ